MPRAPRAKKPAPATNGQPGTPSKAETALPQPAPPQPATLHPVPIEVRASPIAGLGIFATAPIAGGTRLIEYVGERIGSEEAARRYDDDAMEQHHTFLFALDEEWAIDGGVGGNDARYFNHACTPNCEAVIEDGRIFIDTLIDIEPGTELLYDYALMRDDPWQEHWRELYACRCGTEGCRGLILKKPKPPKKRAAKKKSTRKAAAKKSTRKAAAKRGARGARR